VLGNENVFNTIAFLASSCSGGVCSFIKRKKKTKTKKKRKDAQNNIMQTSSGNIQKPTALMQYSAQRFLAPDRHEATLST